MNLETRNVLITGGAGFIGANFVRHWLGTTSSGKVVVLDALTYAGNIDNLVVLDRDPRYVFVRGDICDEATVRGLFDQFDIDTVIHFAAESHVDRSILGPDKFLHTNVIGTHTLLKVAKSHWLDKRKGMAHRFHHVSTDEVYGSLKANDPAFSETTAYAPNSPYSATKAASDHLVRAYHETYGLDTTVTNCSNNYGPYQFPEKLIPLIMINILHGKALPVYGDGLQIRDWLHVADHCHAITRAIAQGKAGEVYNIGGNSEVANIDIVKTLCAAMDEQFALRPGLRAAFPMAPAVQGHAATTLITHVRDRPGHDRRYAINYDKARRDLGYEPSRNLTAGLAATVAWYLANVPWWQALLGRDYDSWVQQNYGT